MDRRSFIINSTLTGAFFYISEIKKAHALGSWDQKSEFYSMFKDPTSIYRPFVRWWWNGDKVQAPEINRELKLLKDAGIGGVEINPIEFPKNADSMGIKSLEWLSDEWIDLVKEACNFGKSLDMHSDLIVGSGWPFGSEELEEDERAEVLIVYAKKLDGPTIFETSRFNIWQEVDPGVTVKNTLRQPEVVSLSLVKDQMNSLEDATDLSSQKEQDLIHVEVPDGPHYFYAVVKYQSFADVINGAPGAAGSILDHMNKNAVQKYLNRMSDKMQNRIGALSNYLRALFHDSMELEGSNWTGDFDKEFKQRCGYDVRPYLPYIMFKVGRLGNVVDENYGAQKTESFAQTLDRVRFDFEFVKASLLKERFTDTYVEWCKNLGVKSRAQGYGRGFFRLLPSMQFDIPEGESWTTNYLLHKLGEEMSDEDYRRGRGYTMINKYVSSAAHLAGKREVSCEEMTDTYLVFNTTLELLKVGSDQSIMSGITHSVWAGFNYSPKDAPFPGWIQYGPYLNEKNNFWPYFHLLNDYKARLSSQLENADQYADIAILPADFDLWS
ncbi:MAG: glycosyl hydrolase, partial [Ginsengibacter sp.]